MGAGRKGPGRRESVLDRTRVSSFVAAALSAAALAVVARLGELQVLEANALRAQARRLSTSRSIEIGEPARMIVDR
jgi:hypothetical protein